MDLERGRYFDIKFLSFWGDANRQDVQHATDQRDADIAEKTAGSFSDSRLSNLYGLSRGVKVESFPVSAITL